MVMFRLWKRFLSPYYLANAALILAYLFLRTLWPHSSMHAISDYFGLTREMEIWCIAGLFAYQRYRKSNTIDEFIDSMFLLCKSCITILLFICSHGASGWYAIVWLITSFTVIKTPYSGPSKVLELRPSEFTSTVAEGDPAVSWLVMFTASWSGTSTNLVPVMADLSIQFSTPKLKFATIDISRWPELAEKYKIDTSSSSQQVPSFIMFDRRKESKRLPPIDAKGEVTAVAIDRKGLVQVFNLERRFVDSAFADDDEKDK